ncbi:hypothetical protein ACLBWX_22890 [Methylobacterium sp. M6A4_1b]
MAITWARTWPDRADARRDFVARDDGMPVGRIYFVQIATGPAWFWAANGIQAAPGTVGCALSGHESTKQAAVDRVKAAWAMWLDVQAGGGSGTSIGDR